MNCKRGDLAFVVFVSGVPMLPNVGRVVRCVRRNGTRHYEGYGDLACWWIRSEGTSMVAGDDAHQAMEGNFPDLALRPIRGEPERVTEKTPEEITA